MAKVTVSLVILLLSWPEFVDCKRMVHRTEQHHETIAVANTSAVVGKKLIWDLFRHDEKQDAAGVHEEETRELGSRNGVFKGILKVTRSCTTHKEIQLTDTFIDKDDIQGTIGSGRFSSQHGFKTFEGMGPATLSLTGGKLKFQEVFKKKEGKGDVILLQGASDTESPDKGCCDEVPGELSLEAAPNGQCGHCVGLRKVQQEVFDFMSKLLMTQDLMQLNIQGLGRWSGRIKNAYSPRDSVWLDVCPHSDLPQATTLKKFTIPLAKDSKDYDEEGFFELRDYDEGILYLKYTCGYKAFKGQAFGLLKKLSGHKQGTVPYVKIEKVAIYLGRSLSGF